MDIIEAVLSRKSIREFKPISIPKEILREILDTAIHTPSAYNSQPWEITVVSGEALGDLIKGNIVMYNYGVKRHMETPVTPLQGVYRQRQVDLAIQLFKLMGIAREDQKKRAEWSEHSRRLFNAPAYIILSMDRLFDNSPMSLLDIGALMQTICLVALNYGLGTCILDGALMFPEVIRKITGIPESKRIIMGIAIGYPDWNFPANKVQSDREPLEKVVTWCGNT